MTIDDKKHILHELQRFGPIKAPTFVESKLINALWVAVGKFDRHGNPKARRLRKLAGQIK